MNQRRTVGIIGFGRFGQLVAKALTPLFDVYVCASHDRSDEAARIGCTFCTLEECSRQENVILCVPISAMESALGRVCPHLVEGATVYDVCSVKTYPCRWLEKNVPEQCRIVGTHPLFGPDTAKNGLCGHKVVVCNPRDAPIGDVCSFLESLGLVVILSSPEDHDREMARSLALIHFLGRSLSVIGVCDVTISTVTHERLLEIVEITNNDSSQLLIDMHVYNPFAAGVRKKMISELRSLDKKLTLQESIRT